MYKWTTTEIITSKQKHDKNKQNVSNKKVVKVRNNKLVGYMLSFFSQLATWFQKMC